MLFGYLLDFSPTTMLILGVLAVLLFGERLPEVARAVGKGLMEFKKGMSGIEEEIRNAVNSATTSVNTAVQSAISQADDTAKPTEEVQNREESAAPKSESPPAAPKLELSPPAEPKQDPVPPTEPTQTPVENQ